MGCVGSFDHWHKYRLAGGNCLLPARHLGAAVSKDRGRRAFDPRQLDLPSAGRSFDERAT